MTDNKKEFHMLYRELPHGGEKIRFIGMGMGSIHESSEEEIGSNPSLS